MMQNRRLRCIQYACIQYPLIGLAIALGGLSIQLPTPAQTPVRSTPVSGVNSSDYLLGPGDEITITVFGYEEYTGARVIAPNGTITLPLIGSMQASGKTASRVAEELTARLNYFLVDPTVTVSTTVLRPVFVTVTGEVQRPGPIQLQSSTARNTQNAPQTGLPTLSSALIAAGGITSRADVRQILLRRSLGNGESTTLTINLWDDIWAESTPENPLLQDGDAIVVPQLAADAEVDRRLMARSSLAPETVRVRVVGEVTRPGEVQVPPNSSLSSAVAIAGGPTDDAKLRQVTFIRLNEAGQIEQQEVDLSHLTDTYQIQEGDVIIVPKRTSSVILDFASRLLNPLGSLFRIFGVPGN